jgi:hypothetical protein
VSGQQRLVALLYSVPLLCESLNSALENIAEVQAFPAGRDTVGLLRAIRPDAVVVDDANEAEEVRRWTKRDGMPLVHIAMRERKIRVFRNGVWEERPGTSAESIRNVLAESFYARAEDGA